MRSSSCGRGPKRGLHLGFFWRRGSMQKLSLIILNPNHHVAKLEIACEAQYPLTKGYFLIKSYTVS